LHYEEYWGLKIAPFENVPDPRFYVAAPKHEEGLHRLLYGIEARKGAVLLTGEIGCGKTTLSRQVLRHLAQDRYDTALLANPSFDPQELLSEVLYQLGIKPDGSKLDRVRRLNQHLLDTLAQKKDMVLIVDEAQTIKDDMIFEELRLLLNYQLNERFLLTIILLGQPELNDRMNAIPQFSQRVGIRFHLPAFTMEETVQYVESRLHTAGADGRPVFSEDAYVAMFHSTGGIPRNINTLSDLCLLSGFLEKSVQVDGSLVDRVVADFRLGGLAGAAR
jgi:general secretion pathway protein A